MKVILSKEDVDLIGKALITHRWKVEDNEGQNDEFHRCASLADRLAYNHDGAEIVFKQPQQRRK